MVKILIFVGLGFLPMTSPVKSTIGDSWSTVCAYNLDGKMKMWVEVKNTGANPFTECRLQKWDGPTENDWSDSGQSILGCNVLKAGDLFRWSTVSMLPNNRVRIQAKSAGTKASCQLFRKEKN